MTIATDLFEFAKSRRDTGMALAVNAQDRKEPRWSDIAYSAIETIARRQIHVHVDDLISANVPAPEHYNAWGSIWTRAIRNGVIQHTNQTRPCKTDPGKHAHRSPVYFSRIYDPRSHP